MMIDLQVLNYKKQLDIIEDVIFDEEIYRNMDIVSLNNVHVDGSITSDIEFNRIIDFHVTGQMILHDSVSYELIAYPFDIKIEETLENSLKTLDLNEFLWHYIVLEVPIRFTKCEGKSIENENYRVISEEEYVKKNNPFSDFFMREE